MKRLESLNLSEKVTPELITSMNVELVGMDIAVTPERIVEECNRIRRDLAALYRFNLITSEDLDELRDYACEYMRDRLERWIKQ